MVSVFEHIENLYIEQLYSSVVSAASLVLSLNDQTYEIMSVQTKFQILVYYGNSLFYLNQFRKAEAMYKRALQFKKSMMKTKNVGKPNEVHKELMPEIDIKYQIHACHVSLKQYNQAIMVLQSIPCKQRNAKINMALGKLYQQAGMERSAITCFKEVLKETPLALDAIEGLLSLGVKGVEVHSLVMETASVLAGMEWFSLWIKAHANLHCREYPQAIATFNQLDNRAILRDNVSVLVALGKCYYFYGDYKNAIMILQRAQMLDPYLTRGLDVLAALLHKENHSKELEKLVPPSLTVTEYTAEAWVAIAYFLFNSKKTCRAAYFAQKACFLSPRNVEALILKGAILFDLKQYQESVIHFREAMQISPYRYEPHKGLVDNYIALRKNREALTIASNACKQLGQTARTLTLYGGILMTDPMGVCKAKSLLEKALSHDETYLPAVYLLAGVYEQEMNLKAAIALLQKQVEILPTCKLHQMLGDLLLREREEEKALHHYNIALNLEPNNRRALEGLHRIDNNSSKMDTSFYMTVAEELHDQIFDRVVDSDNEANNDGLASGGAAEPTPGQGSDSNQGLFLRWRDSAEADESGSDDAWTEFEMDLNSR